MCITLSWFLIAQQSSDSLATIGKKLLGCVIARESRDIDARYVYTTMVGRYVEPEKKI